ncbi:MAG: hypothetical protein ACMXYL_01315 [Candidatus Woesearchaeota archaeon]
MNYDNNDEVIARTIYSDTTMKKKTRGQASVEYLMVSGMMLIVIVPAILAFVQYSNTQTREVESNQILRLGSRLAIETQQVYYGGKGSKSTIEEQVPGILINITYYPLYDAGRFIGGEYVLYTRGYRYDGVSSIGFHVPVNVSLDTDNVAWGPGRRTMIFTTMEDSNRNLYVHLNIT